MKPDKKLPGSTKEIARGARVVGDVDPEHPMSVTVVLRPKSDMNLDPNAPPMSRDQFAARFAADPADVQRVEAYASQHHLTATEVNLAERTIVLRGRTADMQDAFGVSFKLYATEDDQRFRGREGDVYIPHELLGIVQAVLGLDDRPAAKPHLRRPFAVGRAFNSPDVAKLYDFPRQLDGSGQCLAIIELGGGYRLSDMNAYFKSVGVAVPQIVAVAVNGASNNPGVDNGADGEVALDIEVAGAICPKAKIAVYFAPNTDAGFLNAIKTAVHDSVRAPSVVSISWGGPESSWTAAAMQQFDQAFIEAAAVGVTVLAASGDSGSSDGVNDGKPHVDFPASSPHCVGCGGTRVVASGSTIASETVWNDGPHGPGAGGGGVSTAFGKPAYQSKINVPKPGGRGVPDVSGNADPVTGYNVVVDGSKAVIGGTSAVAPLYAALVILLNQARKTAGKPPCGFLLPAVYATAGLCRDVTSDNNDYSGTLGVYKAGAGWDACSGLGSAIGSKWLAAFSAAASLPPRRSSRARRDRSAS